MILTTYAVHVKTDKEYWVLTEGLSCGDKKVVIHQYKDSILGWASAFDDVTQAKAYWECLEDSMFDPRFASKLYRSKYHA